MKILLYTGFVFCCSMPSTQAQLMKKLSDKVKQTTDKAAEKVLGASSGNPAPAPVSAGDAKENSTDATVVSAKSTDLSAYGSYDFVPGDSVLFSDELTDEDLNEIPGKWLLDKGRAEVVQSDGELVIAARGGTALRPRMKTTNYLPKKFTIEFDMRHLSWNKNFGRSVTLNLANPSDEDNADAGAYGKFPIKVWASAEASFDQAEGQWPFDVMNDAGAQQVMKGWKHVAISVNERGVKVYINQYRILNAQVEFGTPSSLRFNIDGDYDAPVLIKNFRVLSGGKNAARQVTTNTPYIARGILFEKGSAKLLPESMGEINALVKVMKDDPAVKFEIGGHTSMEQTSSAEANQKLSDERANTVRNKMMEMGIPAERLTAKGYGQNKPIAANDTPEGRATNRRVEFVKK